MNATFSGGAGRYVLKMERQLAHPPEKVWRALTEREFLRQWFPCDVEGEWTVGSSLQFTFLHGEGEGLSEEEMMGEVLESDPPRFLTFSWGSSILRCELAESRTGCRLVFSETLEDPSMGARNAAGWEFCLENLELLLDGAAVAKFAVDTWKDKFSHYVKKFEPMAGPQQGMPE